MDPRERIRRIKLIEKIDAQNEYSKYLGMKNTSHFKEERSRFQGDLLNREK